MNMKRAASFCAASFELLSERSKGSPSVSAHDVSLATSAAQRTMDLPVSAEGAADANLRGASRPKWARSVDMTPVVQKPSVAFIGASWVALFAGYLAFIIGLWNAAMPLNEKGYYFAVLMYGLFAAVSLQKSVRDRLEGIPVTGIYFGLCWASILISLSLLAIGLTNATLTASEKGFYAMSFVLSVFAAVAVQKNTRDSAAAEGRTHRTSDPET